MLNKQVLSFGLLLIFSITVSLAQDSREDSIRNLENSERKAILEGDTVALSLLMSEKIVVHNPENMIVTYRQIIDRIKQGKINYASFERNIEKITFIENIAIVMGKEILKPVGGSVYAGKTLTRSFTNIWMKDNMSWKLTARQSSIIAIE